MLGMRNYTQAYIDGCRVGVDADLSAYRNLVEGVRSQPARGRTQLDSAVAVFESTFFNNMVLVLDACFVQRLRTIEGKDGNPLNEVRLLCTAMLHNHSIMGADTSIKLSPAMSVLKHQVGDEIKLSEADFVALSAAFFAEIERGYL